MRTQQTKYTGAFGFIDTRPPNTVLREKEKHGFYVSYNARDYFAYGSVTTALVSDSMDRFYILNGDHRKQYAALLDQGWDTCFGYFIANIAQRNKMSVDPIMLDLNVPMPPLFSFSTMTRLNDYDSPLNARRTR